MKNNRYMLGLSIVLLSIILAGCGQKNDAVTPVEDTATKNTATEDAVAEKAQDEQEATVEVEDNLPDTTDKTQAPSLPDTDDVLRFWAKNYEDIASGKYTGDTNSCLYIAAADYDGDTMPELIAGFSDGRGANTYTRLLDADAALTGIQYLNPLDKDGKEYEAEIPFEPFMMFETKSGEKHYISLNFFSNGYANHIQSYNDFCIKTSNANPVISRIKEISTEYYEDDQGTMQEKSTEYRDGNGQEISKAEFYKGNDIYSYMENAAMTKTYRVARDVAYTYNFDATDTDVIYEALKTTYENSYLLEKETKNPYEALAGDWTLIKTSVEGDESEYDSSEGEFIASFDENTLSLYSSGDNLENIDYDIEYISYYDTEELWYAEVGDFGDYQWVNFRLDDKGYLNLMGAIKYSDSDYASIYWTFKKVD